MIVGLVMAMKVSSNPALKENRVKAVTGWKIVLAVQLISAVWGFVMLLMMPAFPVSDPKMKQAFENQTKVTKILLPA